MMTTSRTILVAGNWKMNKTPSETVLFLEQLQQAMPPLTHSVEALICPPTIALDSAVQATENSTVSIGAQTMDYNESGAYTGEISARMLTDCGVNHVIIGHSERREYYNETDTTVAHKAKTALKHGLTPIICVGETQTQRDAQQTDMVVANQVKQGLARLSADRPNITDVVLAYEPIWAIGTGKTCDATEANRVCGHIRAVIKAVLGASAAEKIRVLYGGSVKPSNATELFGQSDIDGGLVGGASLDVESYMGLLNAALAQQPSACSV